MKPFRLYLLPLLLLAACVTKAPLPPPVPVETGEAWYHQAAKSGKRIYPIDSAQSLITITVRRGGALARLGHDHVVASRSVTGFVAPDAGRADFHFRLDQMTVDETALRQAAGLDTQPSAEAIEGTRTNMLTRVLEAERHPVVLLHAERVRGKDGVLRLTVTLHGIERTIETPVVIEQGRASVTASGEMRLRQTDFGITPMSVMGGAMVVQDTMELRFRIVAGAAR
jgi:hypothetical protein